MSRNAKASVGRCRQGTGPGYHGEVAVSAGRMLQSGGGTTRLRDEAPERCKRNYGST